MRNRQRRYRARVSMWLVIVVATSLSGCATVNPQADYARSRELIAQSSGVGTAYDPEKEPLSAEDLQPRLADGLTLTEAVEIALLNNRRLQGAFQEIGIARADWVQAGLLSNPTVGIGLLFPEGGGTSNIHAALAQNIVDLWQMPVKKRLTERKVEQRVVEVARLAGELAVETKRAYYEAVAATELLSIARLSVELYQKSYNATRTQREAGTGTALAENLQRGELLQAQLDLQNAEAAARNTRRQLVRLLSVDEEVATVELTDALPAGVAPATDAEALVALAREHRLDLQALQQAVLAGDAEIQLEYLRIFPEIMVGVSAERNESRALPGRDIAADFARSSLRAGQPTIPDIQTPGERRAAQEQDIEFKIGPNIEITLPIFDQNQAQIARARYGRVQAVKSYEDLFINIAQDIRAAVDQARAQWTSVAFYHDELLPQAERSLEFSTAAWQAGTADVLTLLASQRNLLATRRQYVSAHAAAAASLADLERAVGLPLGRVQAADRGGRKSESAPEDAGGDWTAHYEALRRAAGNWTGSAPAAWRLYPFLRQGLDAGPFKANRF